MSVFKKGTVSGSSGPVARISGMKAWINGVNLTSSGVLTLDKFIGGGLYVSSCTLLLSDRYSTHAHHMAMCFLAEGLAHKHELFTASLEGDVLDSLPLNVHLAQQRKQQERAAVDKGEGKGEPLEDRDLLNPPGGELKIAWQYKKYLSSPLSLSSQTAAPSFGMPLFPRATTSTPNITPYCGNFDLSKHEEAEVRKTAIHTSFSMDSVNVHIEDPITRLLDDITLWISRRNASSSMGRIYINSLGSPLWGNGENQVSKITAFIQKLRSLIKGVPVVAMISIPSHFYTSSQVIGFSHAADGVLRIDSFQGDLAYLKKQYKDLDGLMTIKKLPSFNSLTAFTIETDSFGIKRDRRSLIIERLHLPPDEERTNTSSTSLRSVPCATNISKDPYDF